MNDQIRKAVPMQGEQHAWGDAPVDNDGYAGESDITMPGHQSGL